MDYMLHTSKPNTEYNICVQNTNKQNLESRRCDLISIKNIFVKLHQ